MNKLLPLAFALLFVAGVARSQDQRKVTTIRTTATVAGLNCDATKGEMVFNTTDKQVYKCVDTNKWSKEGPYQFDITQYGATTRQTNSIPTTATTTAGSPNVTLASAQDFKNNEFLVIAKAGAATAQSTPAAPTVTSPFVSGSTTYSYQCKGVDVLGGLTNESLIGTVATGPEIFGALPSGISRISQTSGTVTANFSTPLNGTAGQQVLIVGVTGAGAGFNGTYRIVTAPTGSQITYSLAGNAGVGTVSGTSAGRLINSYNITAASRSGNVLSFTTNATHHFLANGLAIPTIVIIDGMTPNDMNGQYIVDTVWGTGFTVKTGVSSTETGAVMGTATVYEKNLISCPAIAGTTVQYYIYGHIGDSMALIGKTPFLVREWIDWGPFWRQGYTAPAYVPTMPVGAAQNQLFVAQILSGGGTTSLVLNANVTTSVTDAAAMHDDGQAILAAANAALANGGGFVIAPPPANAVSAPGYVVNYPFTMPNVDMVLAAQLTANETIVDSSTLFSPHGPSNSGTPQFGYRNYARLSGLGNPMIAGLGGFNLEGVAIVSLSNGQNGIFLSNGWNTFRDDFFSADIAGGVQSSTAIPVIIGGNNYSFHFTNTGWSCSMAIQNTLAAGQMEKGPPIPCLWVRGNSTGMPSEIIFDGMNSFVARGILVDFSYGGSGFFATNFDFENILNNQAPETPMVMFYGQANASGGVKISHIVMDSHLLPVFANWSSGFHGLWMDNILTTGATPWVTGLPISGLVTSGSGISAAVSNAVGQNWDVTWEAIGSVNLGAGFVLLSEKFQGRPLVFIQPNNYPAFWEQPIVQGLTSSQGNTGSVPAGAKSYTVQTIGWNGGESSPSTPTLISADGAHQINLSWTAVGVPIQGYNVCRSGYRQNPTPITTNTFTVTSDANFAACPVSPGTGLPLIDSTQVASSLFRFANGFFKADFAAPRLTASRSYKTPDGDGSLVVSAPLATTAATADIVAIQGATASSHCTMTSTNASAATNVATTYISAKSANQVTVTHKATSGMTYDIACTVN